MVVLPAWAVQELSQLEAWVEREASKLEPRVVEVVVSPTAWPLVAATSLVLLHLPQAQVLAGINLEQRVELLSSVLPPPE